VGGAKNCTGLGKPFHARSWGGGGGTVRVKKGRQMENIKKVLGEKKAPIITSSGRDITSGWKAGRGVFSLDPFLGPGVDPLPWRANISRDYQGN